MKQAASEFAIAGGSREFDRELPVGQLYFPNWEQYEQAMRGIIERRYYTNHGPLVRELESRLEGLLGVRNAVTVSNATVGLYLVALALGVTGSVMMPAFTFVATPQAVLLAGLEVAFCDVDPESHHVTAASADAALDSSVSALCAVNLWGGAADVSGLESWAGQRGIELFFDSAQAFGVEGPAGRLGRHGAAEVFSFHATKTLSAAEGGCVCTDDDELAERIRNMRSNYGIRRQIPVSLTVNARMSEGQAAVALHSLDTFESRVEANAAVFDVYRDGLSSVEGITLTEPAGVARSNYQSVVIRVSENELGLSRDGLWSILRAEGVRARRYFKPGAHRSVPFSERYPTYVGALPVTDELCDSLIQLPIGALVSTEAAARIADLVARAQLLSPELRRYAG
jgi:dTDP-4-amino-4,6-dideoxygalactose transaminase